MHFWLSSYLIVHVHVYTMCMHARTCTHTHARAHTHTHTHTRTCTHTHTHAHARMYTHTHTHTRERVCLWVLRYDTLSHWHQQQNWQVWLYHHSIDHAPKTYIYMSMGRAICTRICLLLSAVVACCLVTWMPALTPTTKGRCTIPLFSSQKSEWDVRCVCQVYNFNSVTCH